MALISLLNPSCSFLHAPSWTLNKKQGLSEVFKGSRRAGGESTLGKDDTYATIYRRKTQCESTPALPARNQKTIENYTNPNYPIDKPYATYTYTHSIL
jgi:hypothetical protein